MRAAPLLLALAGCTPLAAPTDGAIGATVTASFAFDGATVRIAATRVAPDTGWLRIYAAAASCAGLPNHPDGLTWFVMPTPIAFAAGVSWTGAYDAEGRSIFLVAGDTMSIAHEALHDLLWRARRERGHPRPPFGRCAPVSG